MKEIDVELVNALRVYDSCIIDDNIDLEAIGAVFEVRSCGVDELLRCVGFAEVGLYRECLDVEFRLEALCEGYSKNC